MSPSTPSTPRRRADTLEPGRDARAVAAAVPPQRRVAARPLSWKNPQTLLLGVLAAFQAGVITTLLWTSGATSKGSAESGPPVTANAPEPAADAAPRMDSSSAARTSASAAPAASPTAPAPPAQPSADRTVSAPPPSPSPPRRSRVRDPGDEAPRADPPAASGGLVEVDIHSEPEGATVKIAGAVWGQTPLTALLPTARPVDIKLELPGYAPATLRWTPAKKRSLRTALSPLENP